MIYVSVTHWGRLMHICVRRLTVIGPDNGLSPYRRQAIIRTNSVILLIGPLGKKLQWNQNSCIFIQKNTLENVWKMADILSRPHTVKLLHVVLLNILQGKCISYLLLPTTDLFYSVTMVLLQYDAVKTLPIFSKTTYSSPDRARHVVPFVYSNSGLCSATITATMHAACFIGPR